MDRTKDRIIFYWKAIDLVLAAITVAAIIWLPSVALIDTNLYPIAVTVAAASLTISIFVCTMNYTGDSEGIKMLVREHGTVFRGRWAHIFISTLIALGLPIVAMVIDEFCSTAGNALGLFSIVLSLLQASRAIRLLLLLVEAKDTADEIQQIRQHMQDVSSKL
ncbi:MAG TPA: hypothetical protein H9821_04895 [Candidatus Rothia avicola]|uniref:Uncharacterized protein n=1 Tax=Candidatus Rothia avicola TaxID=2840478 RepID=A0A9D1ZR94_9MICC|nr:hypothetical protein [Candidatus Rothia avicola]